MQITKDSNAGQYQITAYEPGIITVNGQSQYQQSLVISAQTLQDDWKPQSLNELQDDDWQPILALQPRIILLGTGRQHIIPSAEQLRPLYEAGLGVECMSTGAACRTFMALMSENREVVAALLIN